MKVLISDSLHADGIAVLKQEGFTVIDKPGMSLAELQETIKDVEGLIIRSATTVNEELLKNAPKLKVVARAGAGVDNVDIPAATARGVVVMNTPGQNSNAAAELALAHIFSLSRRLTRADQTMKAGLWEKKKLQGREVKGKTLGIMGLGAIGAILAELAQGVKMQVMGHDPYIKDEDIRAKGIEPVSFEQLLAQADFISLHVPRTKETTNLFNAANLAKMKKGACLINCARGGVVDEQALCQALQSGHLAGAALDVFAAEPLSPDSPLLKLDNIALTPHLGADTYESQINVALAAARQVARYLKTGQADFALNR